LIWSWENFSKEIFEIFSIPKFLSLLKNPGLVWMSVRVSNVQCQKFKKLFFWKYSKSCFQKFSDARTRVISQKSLEFFLFGLRLHFIFLKENSPETLENLFLSQV